MSQNERGNVRGLEPADCPPVDPRPYYRVAHVPSVGKLQAVFLCNELFGTLLHYAPECRSRLIPHVENCPACAPNNQPRWYGYAAVLEGALSRPRLLALSAASVRFSPEMAMYRGQLRGHVFNVFRTVAKANGPIKLEWVKRLQPNLLLPCWDIKTSVERLLGIMHGPDLGGATEGIPSTPEGDPPGRLYTFTAPRIDPAHHI